MEVLDFYEYMNYLLKQVTLIRDLPKGAVDYSKFLSWNLPCHRSL